MTRLRLAVPLLCALVVSVPRTAASQVADGGAQRVERLLRQMTLEEKVGQMTQLGLQMFVSRGGGPGSPVQIDSAKLRDAIVRRGVGALLNVAYVAMSPEEWRDANTMIARFAAQSRLKVPVLYGIDAVHGQHLPDHEHGLPAEHRDGGDVRSGARSPHQRDHGVRDARERHPLELRAGARSRPPSGVAAVLRDVRRGSLRRLGDGTRGDAGQPA